MNIDFEALLKSDDLRLPVDVSISRAAPATKSAYDGSVSMTFNVSNNLV